MVCGARTSFEKKTKVAQISNIKYLTQPLAINRFKGCNGWNPDSPLASCDGIHACRLVLEHHVGVQNIYQPNKMIFFKAWSPFHPEIKGVQQKIQHAINKG